MIDSKTGFFVPPQAPCVKGEGKMCPLREKLDSPFCCVPEDCHSWKFAKSKDENKQEKLV